MNQIGVFNMKLTFNSKKGKWKLLSPYRNGIVLSYDSLIKKRFRRQGFGSLEHGKRLKVAKALGYSCIICTVVSTNVAEKTILRRNHWEKVHEFDNDDTKNIVEICVKNL